jgi:SRSO17 transposase
MERRFEVRKQEILAECELDPRVLKGMLLRLGTFLVPFAEHLLEPEQGEHARTYIEGLLSDLRRKSAEMIAYQHDQDRKNLQHFLGVSDWDHRPLLRQLVQEVGRQIGRADGVLVFDPSAFPKHGKRSVGVARQWCGRLGKTENCQVAVCLGYVSSEEHALVDMRLYLPKEWTQNWKRCRAAGVPKGVRFQTRHELSREMLLEHRGTLLHAWVAGDDEMGRPGHFRRELAHLDEQYLLAVPSNTTIRDLTAAAPPYSGRGRRPKPPPIAVRDWCTALPADAWTRVDVRDGEKGPLLLDVAILRAVLAKTEHRWLDYSETLVVVRTSDPDGVVKYDYHLSNAPPETPLQEFARVICAMHRIEECIKRAKSEASLAQYQVRTWNGWHHHQTLALLATWFLLRETRRGKKIHRCAYGARGAALCGLAPEQRVRISHAETNPPFQRPHRLSQRVGASISLQNT